MELARLCDRFKWHPDRLDDLTPEELTVFRTYVAQQLQQEREHG